MKKIMIVAMIVLSGAQWCFAQNTGKTKQSITPPEAVKTAFNKAFPRAGQVKWEKEGAGYEANFMNDGKQLSTVYRTDGVLQETEITINPSELPAEAAKYIADHYPSSKIKSVAQLTQPGGKWYYEVELEKMDVLFDTTGKFIKETKD